MGGGIPKPAEISESVGNVIKGTVNDRINSAGPGSNVLCGGTVGALLQQREIGGDQVDAQGHGGDPPLGGVTDH